MAKLVALDQPQGPFTPSLISEIWERGNAVCVLDQRFSTSIKKRYVDALLPDEIWHENGEVTQLPGGVELIDGAALVVATSGTTSSPKAVVHTMKNLIASANSTSQSLGVDPSLDHWICPLPISHIGGMSVITRSLLTSTPITVLGAMDPTEVRSLVIQGANLISVVTQMLTKMDIADFKTVLLGGQNPPPNLPQNVVATYGMTETGSGVVYGGRLIPQVEARILNGEILLKGPMIASGYRNGDPVTDNQGWLHTDDYGSIDDAGLLHVEGRISELINTGGEKVFPHEVEVELQKIKGVLDCCVVGVPDTYWGEAIVAVIVMNTDHRRLDLSDLKSALSDRLPPWALPKSIQFVDAIPRTALGKPQRTLVRKTLLAR
ncbi:MAG: acyl--CoA ligase [Acidimicrobiaceae bacterium]|nr:acyl--CoA ligase [Acidimicrobiaceae bacterium]